MKVVFEKTLGGVVVKAEVVPSLKQILLHHKSVTNKHLSCFYPCLVRFIQYYLVQHMVFLIASRSFEYTSGQQALVDGEGHYVITPLLDAGRCSLFIYKMVNHRLTILLDHKLLCLRLGHCHWLLGQRCLFRFSHHKHVFCARRNRTLRNLRMHLLRQRTQEIVVCCLGRRTHLLRHRIDHQLLVARFYRWLLLC